MMAEISRMYQNHNTVLGIGGKEEGREGEKRKDEGTRTKNSERDTYDTILGSWAWS